MSDPAERESYPCPTSPAGAVDLDGFCSVHGNDCQDFASWLQSEHATPDEDDAEDDEDAEDPSDPYGAAYDPESAPTADDPRFPEVAFEADRLPRDLLSVVATVNRALHERGVSPAVLARFSEEVLGEKSFDAGMARVLTWVLVLDPAESGPDQD